MLIKAREFPENLAGLAALPPILQRIYAARGISDAAQLDKRLQALLPFTGLTDIEKACQRLVAALRRQEKILVIGDFDADGATSTALALTALRAMGALHVSYLVPNRFAFGYGLTPGIVAVAKQSAPNLIITVDNGIASIEGVDAANAAGIDVVVTDHHLPAEELPKAYAIVNPNQQGDSFASKAMAGVGVIFYLMLALRRHLVELNWFQEQGLSEPNMAQFLDLVALGTVADVVALDQNNRILVSQGLQRIRQGQCRTGVLALISVAGRRLDTLTASDLGFAVAPRLNAAGRLDDMSLGIECLLAEDLAVAQKMAQHLDTLNTERRKIEASMKDQALAALDKLTWQTDVQALPEALCLYDETWHQGVIGILAGRLKDSYHRPVIAFAAAGDGELKGSARSIPQLNIRDVLAAVAKNHPGLITKFGGHAMAAGLSLPAEHFTIFQQAFVAEVRQHYDSAYSEGIVFSDGALCAHEFTLELAQSLQMAGPWGQQFPEPVFDNVFEVIEQRLVGQHHLKLTLKSRESDGYLDAIAFYIDPAQWPNYRAKKIHAAYTLDINEYQGRVKLQLKIVALQAMEGEMA